MTPTTRLRADRIAGALSSISIYLAVFGVCVGFVYAVTQIVDLVVDLWGLS